MRAGTMNSREQTETSLNVICFSGILFMIAILKSTLKCWPKTDLNLNLD